MPIFLDRSTLAPYCDEAQPNSIIRPSGHVRSNDPMYEMFVKTMGKNYVQARRGDIAPGSDSSFPDLRNWLPVMIEPVPKKKI
jgi:hypothetical protein